MQYKWILNRIMELENYASSLKTTCCKVREELDRFHGLTPRNGKRNYNSIIAKSIQKRDKTIQNKNK